MRYRIVLGVVASVWASAASGASLDDLSPTLKAKVECMARVLKREGSGIDHIKFGVSDWATGFAPTSNSNQHPKRVAAGWSSGSSRGRNALCSGTTIAS